MKNSKKCKFDVFGLASVGVCALVLTSGSANAGQEGELAAAGVESDIAATPMEMLSNGNFHGHARVIYFHSENAYYSPGLDQDTASYGGKLGFKTAKYNGLSFGVSGYMQRPLSRSSDPSKVDGYVGPTLTAMGEAYARWENKDLSVTVGNQVVDLPFASNYDWRMAEQLFQGASVRYGLTDDNYFTAVRMTRFKSYIDNSFKRRTTYNNNVDPYSPVGDRETSGFYGVGGVKTFDFSPVSLKAQAWYFNYIDYAKMGYVEATVTAKRDGVKPFGAVQVFRQTGDGQKLLGEVDSKVYGIQGGVKQNSLTVAASYNRIVPSANSYLNGALITPYSHNVASGPMFAQPFLSSTQDLGAGNAYALDVNGSPAPGWFVGVRYSYMDVKNSASAQSLRQREYLGYAIYNFGGKFKGLSVTDFIARASSPIHNATFWQNRLAMEYKW